MTETEMEQLHRICTQWLHGADLCGLTISPQGRIFMQFIVGGTSELEYWVDLECRGVHVFNMSKAWEDDFSGIFIGAATIDKFDNEDAVRAEIFRAGFYVELEGSLPGQLYEFRAEGGTAIRVICTELQMTERQVKLDASQTQNNK